MNLNQLPFQYTLRGDHLARLDGQMLAEAHEQRDRDLEDYLGELLDVISTLEARVTALET
jgi:hypothetical protein